MGLYVDHGRIRYRGMRMSHLLADSTDELEDTERALGLPRGSIQYRGTYREHLDVSESKRAQAIAHLGAQEVSRREIGLKLIARRRATEDAQQGQDE